MNLKTKLTCIAMLLFCITMYAQESFTLKGKVVAKTDSQPVPGVNVLNVKTSKGAATNFDGLYEIVVTKGDVVKFSYVGFVTQTVIIGDQKTLDITLEDDASALDEVVVIGYGTQKKSHSTGAISKVTNENLDQIAVSRVDDALVGQVSGVSVSATEGEAGSAPTIRIRGTGSISSNSSPLIVVDGMVVSDDFLGNLDMNDVASFEVLKDAASSAIYGSRGANGVIQIITKSGKSGKTKFTYNTYTGFKEARQSDAYDFSVAKTAEAEMAATGTLSDRTRYKQLIGVDNNWQNIIFDGGTITSHSLSARGGNEKTKFSIALGYLNDEGVLLTDEYTKYNLQIKLDQKFSDKFTAGFNISPSYSERRRFDGSTHDILRQPSWLPLYLDANTIQFVNRLRDGGAYADAQIGDYAQQRMFDNYDLNTGTPLASGGTSISNTSNTNPAAKVLERQRHDYKLKMYGSGFLKYDFTEDLSFKTSLSGSLQNTRQERFQGVLASRNGLSAIQSDYAKINETALVSDNVFSYSKTFNDSHEVNAILGLSSELRKGEYTATRIAGYDAYTNTIIPKEPDGTGGSSVSAANDFMWKQSLLAYFARVNYAFEDRYLASLSYRRDGSSVFGSETKWGGFAAVSLGWNIHNEDFFGSSWFDSWVNRLKLRASYGTTGTNNLDLANRDVTNDDYLINFYPSLPLLANTSYNGQEAIYALNIANVDLQWERSAEINLALDFGFFNNVVSGSVDWYQRTSDQLLLYNPISYTTGQAEALQNIGEVKNTGIEVELRTRNVSNEKFKWSTTILATMNNNELVNFADSNGQITSVDSKRAAEWINLEGNPISSFYGWVVDEEIPLEYLSNPYHPIGGQAQDVYVKDLNGDGVIDDDDKTILGDPYPDLVWSITNDFKIGSVDLSFMFQGSHGAEIRNMADQYMFNHFNSSQDFIPSTPNQQFIKEKIFTNSIVQDASYVALRNINIGFTMPKDFTEKFNFSKIRVYATAQNLLYFTADGYTGWNPESIYHTTGTSLATTYGYQRGGSPIQQTISLGLNVEF